MRKGAPFTRRSATRFPRIARCSINCPESTRTRWSRSSAKPAAPLPFTGFVAGVLSFGRGVAYEIDAPALVGLRQDLAIAFSRWLSDQDRQRYRPHVTIQNKADPAAARRLLTSLEEDFARWPLRIEGLALWRYRGGPWEAAATCRFGQEPVRTG